MIVGHAMIAFALAASVAAWRGFDRRLAIQVGLTAAAFAVVPDVDMTYAAVGLLGTDASSLFAAADTFWAHSAAVHRTITHSVVLAVPAALAFALLPGGRRSHVGALAILATLAGATFVISGATGAVMMALYGLTGTVVALGASRVGMGSRAVGAAAFCGLLTHPFGDLVTGTPPHMAYPIPFHFLQERVVLLSDPTLNLLSVFGLEIATVWLGVAVAARLLDVSVREQVHWSAVGGIGYGATGLVLPAPTLDTSYHFVFSVLAVGAVGVTPASLRLDRADLGRVAVTGLLAVTLAGLAYGAVYLAA